MRQKFFTGLIILLPLAFTWWVLSSIIALATQPFQNITRNWLHNSCMFQGYPVLWLFEPQLVFLVSTCLILIVLTCAIYFVGTLGNWFLLRWCVEMVDMLFLSMPLVNKIYKSCKEMTRLLFTKNRSQFSQVVWVPFPTSNQKCMGFVITDLTLPCYDNESYIAVLIPGTPNPITGYLLFFLQHEVEKTDISVELGIKWILSCGSTSIPGIE